MNYSRNPNESGFTLMEIVVATTIFAFLVAGMTDLMQYTLRINRKSDAIRQASQGMRNMVEFLAKEIRSGRIDYGVINGDTIQTSAIGPCTLPTTLGADTYKGYTSGLTVPAGKDNRLGLITLDGKRECIYFAYNNPNKTWISDASFPTTPVFVNTSSTPGTLVLEKEGGIKELLTPANVQVQEVVFFIRPTCDPATKPPAFGGPGCSTYSNDYPRLQPFVTMNIKFLTTLNTGEAVPIYYQTTISTDKYDIPN